MNLFSRLKRLGHAASKVSATNRKTFFLLINIFTAEFRHTAGYW